MSDFLQQMAEVSAGQARLALEETGQARLESRARSAPPAVPLDVSQPGFDVIAEAKLASPSEGKLGGGSRTAERVVALADDFVANGAAAVSVLTETTRFDGSLDHLQATALAIALPVMRKDFLVDPIQVSEARAFGASGVLLIARLLPGELLVEMTDQAMRLGMFVLVEVFDRSDLETAVSVFDRDVLVGVNCRDLVTLDVDKDRFESLAPHLPDHLPAVAESGITSPDDVAHVASLGYRLALIGSTLVSRPDPGAELRKLIAAGRSELFGAS